MADRAPPQAVVDGCLVGYRWDAATASYVNRDSVPKPSGLGRGFSQASRRWSSSARASI
ncbi:MAG: hypothetical protein IPH44_24025 [Myxococcales bacterium]|nr:hypothetical protein [Myxococcales bacterium]